MKVLLTGATGYIGGRLAPRLLESGHRVRCLVRSERKLAARPWARQPGVEVVEADLADREAVTAALEGCDVAYYLVHSMETAGAQYAERDRRLAETFSRAAEAAATRRIIYLGGLGELGQDLSEHLGSRREVERCLASTKVPVTVLRAAMIIGAGSASFEILRYLVERLPVMITPKWVRTESQPIAVTNVLHYLVKCLEVEETVGATLDIGGPEVLGYADIIQIMAAARGLRRRLILPVPVLTPRLSSAWIHLVTPVSYNIARPLAEGLRNRVVCRDDRAARWMPQKLLTVREAIEAALGQSMAGEVETSWTDAGVVPGDPDWAGGTRFTDERSIEVHASPREVFEAVVRLGGGHGYHAAHWLWRLRGLMDRLVGGPGLRRGRRHPQVIRVGDALDFWRVIDLEPDRRLLLRAEMRLPGEALLELRIEPVAGTSRSKLTQTARFQPRGLGGLLYWWLVTPFHGPVFRGMLEGLRQEAETHATSQAPG